MGLCVCVLQHTVRPISLMVISAGAVPFPELIHPILLLLLLLLLVGSVLYSVVQQPCVRCHRHTALGCVRHADDASVRCSAHHRSATSTVRRRARLANLLAARGNWKILLKVYFLPPSLPTFTAHFSMLVEVRSGKWTSAVAGDIILLCTRFIRSRCAPL